ncbi:hypothetical protein ACJX0J_023507, partial [Zea mays]
IHYPWNLEQDSLTRILYYLPCSITYNVSSIFMFLVEYNVKYDKGSSRMDSSGNKCFLVALVDSLLEDIFHGIFVRDLFAYNQYKGDRAAEIFLFQINM